MPYIPPPPRPPSIPRPPPIPVHRPPQPNFAQQHHQRMFQQQQQQRIFQQNQQQRMFHQQQQQRVIQQNIEQQRMFHQREQQRIFQQNQRQQELHRQQQERLRREEQQRRQQQQLQDNLRRQQQLHQDNFRRQQQLHQDQLRQQQQFSSQQSQQSEVLRNLQTSSEFSGPTVIHIAPGFTLEMSGTNIGGFQFTGNGFEFNSEGGQVGAVDAEIFQSFFGQPSPQQATPTAPPPTQAQPASPPPTQPTGPPPPYPGFAPPPTSPQAGYTQSSPAPLSPTPAPAPPLAGREENRILLTDGTQIVLQREDEILFIGSSGQRMVVNCLPLYEPPPDDLAARSGTKRHQTVRHSPGPLKKTQSDDTLLGRSQAKKETVGKSSEAEDLYSKKVEEATATGGTVPETTQGSAPLEKEVPPDEGRASSADPTPVAEEKETGVGSGKEAEEDKEGGEVVKAKPQDRVEASGNVSDEGSDEEDGRARLSVQYDEQFKPSLKRSSGSVSFISAVSLLPSQPPTELPVQEDITVYNSDEHSNGATNGDSTTEVEIVITPTSTLPGDETLPSVATSEQENGVSPAYEAKASDGPALEEKAGESPVTEKEASESPASEEKASESPASEEKASESPASEEKASESPAPEEKASESLASEEKASKSPVSEKEASESPVSEEKASESPASEEKAGESPAPKEKASENPVLDEKVSESLVSEEKVGASPSPETKGGDTPGSDLQKPPLLEEAVQPSATPTAPPVTQGASLPPAPSPRTPTPLPSPPFTIDPSFMDRSGWLSKLSHRKGMFGDKWQKRYFVLHGSWLYYFKKYGDTNPRGVIRLLPGGWCKPVPQGTPRMADAVVNTSAKGPRIISLLRCFCVHRPSNHAASLSALLSNEGVAEAFRSQTVSVSNPQFDSRTFYMIAASDEEKDLWVEALRTNIKAYSYSSEALTTACKELRSMLRAVNCSVPNNIIPSILLLLHQKMKALQI